MPAAGQEPGAGTPLTERGLRTPRVSLIFVVVRRGWFRIFAGEVLLFILVTARYQTLRTNPLRCRVTLGPTSCL